MRRLFEADKRVTDLTLQLHASREDNEKIYDQWKNLEDGSQELARLKQKLQQRQAKDVHIRQCLSVIPMLQEYVCCV